ncbi:MAG TPA: carbohydrate ABC transporter permease [Candidatus Paenibacillus intestinavium]|nr:carbohydrate ABC transporter permease [Candidatus Paenibacillus intestinavium]
MRIINIFRSTTAYIILLLGAVIMVFPFLWTISTSLKSGGAVMNLPPEFIPDPIMWSNYKEVLIKFDFLRYTGNSFFLVLLNVSFTIISCSLIAFGMAMYNFRGKTLMYLSMLGTLMLPFQVTMIPKYFIWKELSVLDTYFPLVIPSLLGGAFGIFLMHQYFKGLPYEFYEAALVDGYKPWGIFWKIYFPLAGPAIVALMIFTFMDSWNNTIEPLLYLKNKDLYTLPLAMLYIKGLEVGKLHLVLAGAVITMIPTIIVFLIGQKYFVEGISSTGVKG